MTAAIVLDGWTLRVDGDEPRVRDLDLGERAGLKVPRDIRRTIKAALADNAILPANDGVGATHAVPSAWSVTESVPRPNGGGLQDVEVFYLNEEAALVVLTRLRTKLAVEVTKALVRVFVAARRGELAPPRAAQAQPAALETYREGVAALERAKAAGAIDDRGLALRQASLLKTHLGVDIFAAPIEGFAALPELATLAEGERLIVTKPVDKTGHYSATELGLPYGLSAYAVGKVVDAVGNIRGNPAHGKWSPITGGQGQVVNQQWLYNETARAELSSHLAAERDRRASKQLPLGKRGAS